MEQILLFLHHNYVVFGILLLIILKLFIIDFGTIKTAAGRVLLPYWPLVLLGILYPIGKLCQFTMIGPSVLRSYLSDIGFVACVTAYGCTRYIADRKQFIGIKRAAYYWMILGLCIAVGYEFFQLWLDTQVDSTAKPFTGRGDWADMFVYCYTAFACFLFIRGMEEPLIDKQNDLKKKSRLPYG